MFKKFLNDRGGNFGFGFEPACRAAYGSRRWRRGSGQHELRGKPASVFVDIALLATATKRSPEHEIPLNSTLLRRKKCPRPIWLPAGIAGADFNYIGATNTKTEPGNVTLSAVGTKPFTGDPTSLFNERLVRDAAVVRSALAAQPACWPGRQQRRGESTGNGSTGCGADNPKFAFGGSSRWSRVVVMRLTYLRALPAPKGTFRGTA